MFKNFRKLNRSRPRMENVYRLRAIKSMRAISQILPIVIIVVLLLVFGIVAWFFSTRPAPVPSPTPEPSTTPIEVEWMPDGIIVENEYENKLVFANGRFEVYWSNDQEYLLMALRGKTGGWLSIGFEPSSRMMDADMIFGWVENGEVTALDLFSIGLTGPHPEDTTLGGTNDILEYGGKEDDDYTVIEFKRKLETGDEYDNGLTVGSTIKIIWAMADVDELKIQHNIIRGGGEINLD